MWAWLRAILWPEFTPGTHVVWKGRAWQVLAQSSTIRGAYTLIRKTGEGARVIHDVPGRWLK